ncbi:hypothetical protein STRIP9103_00729, partial [Streptomyces ipomoeae 91-03]
SAVDPVAAAVRRRRAQNQAAPPAATRPAAVMPSGTAALPVLASGSSEVPVSLSAPFVPPVVVTESAVGVGDAVVPEPVSSSAPAKVTGIRTVWLWSLPRVWSLRVITEQVTPDLAQSVLASLARTLSRTENVPLCPLPP